MALSQRLTQRDDIFFEGDRLRNTISKPEMLSFYAIGRVRVSGSLRTTVTR